MTIALEAYSDPEAPDDSLLAATARLATAGDGLDQLHCRSRQATSELAALARLRPGMRVLDVGSGLGGPARHLADECGVRVTGLEPVAAYVRIARLLTRHARMEHLVAFERGNALSTPFGCDTFDGAWLQHVLPTVIDKARVFSQIRRTVVAGGVLAVHEIVAPDGHGMVYPLPWAATPARSYVPRPERLRDGIESAGFTLKAWRNTTVEASDWCRRLVARAEARQRAGRRLTLLGPDGVRAIRNLAANFDAGRLGVVMAVFENTRVVRPRETADSLF